MALTASGGSSYTDEQLIAMLDGDAGDGGLSDQGPGGFNLRYILTLIRANLVLIAGIIALAMLAALVMTLLDTPRYTARATVQINQQADRVLGQNQDNNQDDSAGWDVDRFLQTQVDVLGSRGVAARVAQKLKLFGNARFIEAMGSEPFAAGTPSAIVRDSTIGYLQGNLASDLPRNSRILSINFESTDPEMSAQIANAFATEFIASNLQRKFDSTSYARQFVAEQLSEAKDRLEASEIAVNSYARQAGLIRTRDAIGGDSLKDGSGGESVISASLVQLNQAANNARTQRIEAESRWNAMAASRSPLGSAEVISNPTVQALLTKRAEVSTRLREERARHREGHPTVIQLRAQSDEVERQLSSIVGSVRASVKSQYEAALATERNLARQVTGLMSDTQVEQQRGVQYNLLAREADTNRTIYDGLLQRYKELNAASGIAASNISIIDEAETPRGPSSPNLLKNLAIALVIGAGLAGLVILLRSQFDDSIRVPEDVEAKLRLPLLGVIPKSPDDLMVELDDPKSPVSEAYNSLGGSLLYSTTDGLPETLLVTSAQPSEGKSITSLAIARGFARIGKRVVLADMDLRRPSVHRYVDSDNSRGMSTLLTSNEPVESVLIESGFAGLKLIPSGPVPPSPTELIASNRMQSLIDELAGKFDVVVIDSPPVLGLADAPLMSALVDGVIVIVEADRSRRGTLKSSLRRLRAMRPVVLGAVLTKFDASKLANRYSEYYSYDYYRYGYDDDGSGNGGRKSRKA